MELITPEECTRAALTGATFHIIQPEQFLGNDSVSYFGATLNEDPIPKQYADYSEVFSEEVAGILPIHTKTITTQSI